MDDGAGLDGDDGVRSNEDDGLDADRDDGVGLDEANECKEDTRSTTNKQIIESISFCLNPILFFSFIAFWQCRSLETVCIALSK